MESVEFYLDESESGDGRWLCVAGWIFAKENRERLGEQWASLLKANGLPYFRMVDCAQGTPPFDRFDSHERGAIERQFFDVLKAHALVGFCATYDLQLAHLCPTAIDRHGERFNVTPYTLCCYWSFLLAKHWGDYVGYKGQIGYSFEAGHASQSQAGRMMSDVFSNPELCEIFRYGTHEFVKKRESAAVQCADILAWQWCKRTKDRANGKAKPRADLMALMTAIPCATIHFDERVINGFREEVLGYSKHDGGEVSTLTLSAIWSGVMARQLPSYWSGRVPFGHLPH